VINVEDNPSYQKVVAELKREQKLGRAALFSTGMDPSIHSDVFTRYERGVLEIEHCVDDVGNFTHPSEGMKLRQRRMINSTGV
jgi:hypothetical protein